MKLHNNKVIVIISSFALVTTLSSCTPDNKNSLNKDNRENLEIINDNQTKENKTEEKNFTNEYLEELKQDFKELENYDEDKWNSEKCIEKRKKFKEKISILTDFVFNGKEINGITFKELKEKEKENIKKELDNLDNKMEEYIPDYKERLKDWFIDKSADAKELLVDTGASIKEMWNNYKEEVNKDYNSRKLSKRI